ncbi:MAG TPA: hypothetical protein VLA90_01655 [Actinomycetota bacterium]|nr:hypothetical protein [Actinomycetota bacterium]
MILCVAANPSIDRLIEVDHVGPGAIHRPGWILARGSARGPRREAPRVNAPAGGV